MSIGNVPEVLSQRILVGIILAGRLGVSRGIYGYGRVPEGILEYLEARNSWRNRGCGDSFGTAEERGVPPRAEPFQAFRGNHLSNATCLTHDLLKFGE